MINMPNHKRKPRSDHKSADKPESSEPLSGKPEGGKKTSSSTIFKIIVMSIVLAGIPITAIIREFNGLIEIKLGLEGAQVLIDGRKPPLPPLITQKTSNND
jgi:hypothetical protein